MFRNVKWLVLGLSLVLTACGPMSDDRYGVYADGDYFIVANYDRQKINFTTDSQPGADVLLKDIEAGKGIAYTTWRNASSCGLHDAKGNYFIVPRHADRLDYKGEIFQIIPQPEAFTAANGGQATHETTVKVISDNLTRMVYTYDDTLGIRSIDRYDANGQFDRKIVLLHGVGLLEHCRGWSTDDFGDN